MMLAYVLGAGATAALAVISRPRYIGRWPLAICVVAAGVLWPVVWVVGIALTVVDAIWFGKPNE